MDKSRQLIPGVTEHDARMLGKKIQKILDYCTERNDDLDCTTCPLYHCCGTYWRINDVFGKTKLSVEQGAPNYGQ